MDPCTIKWTTTDAPSVPHQPEGVSFVPNPDAFGYVDWMEPLSLGNEHYDFWCSKIGAVVAQLHLGEKRNSDYIMDGLPERYSLYCHHKTSRGKHDRNDVYLYGARGGFRFRSPGEFQLHAVWLMKGARENECECIKCTHGKSQIDINRRYALPGLKVHPERRKRDSV
ncbi:hypothetical protein FRC09_010343 [Ceratobasidium sp. 395]|nr:hypothetical protein FRC09_010343 [Ceratobasidium sp. 395]